MKKYELTEDSKVVDGKTLYQIKAIRNIDRFGIEIGALGGYIEKEENLSQDGDAWVYGDARVSGNARVYGDARVSGDAWVSGDAIIKSGKYKTSPLYIQGSMHSLNMITPDKLRIGCEEHELDFWEKNYVNIGAMNDYSNDEIKEYREYIQLFINRLGKGVLMEKKTPAKQPYNTRLHVDIIEWLRSKNNAAKVIDEALRPVMERDRNNGKK